MLNRLDAILLKHGGRLYLAKDATMTATTKRANFDLSPEQEELLAHLRAIQQSPAKNQSGAISALPPTGSC